MPDWLLILIGVAIIPTVVGTGLLLTYAGRAISSFGERMLRRIPLGHPAERARFAAVAACCRRAHLFTWFGVGVTVTFGFDGSDAERFRRAVYRELVPPARMTTPEERAAVREQLRRGREAATTRETP